MSTVYVKVGLLNCARRALVQIPVTAKRLLFGAKTARRLFLYSTFFICVHDAIIKSVTLACAEIQTSSRI